MGVESQLDLKQLVNEAGEQVAQSTKLAELDEVRVRYLGKSGLLTAQLKKLGTLPKEERPAAGQAINVAKQAVIKAGQYAYRDRRQKKRQFRSLWIARINAGARENGLSYSRMIHGLNLAGVEIDRKILADLAIFDKPAFAALAEQAKASISS